MPERKDARPFDPQRLILARRLRGVKKTELALAAGVSPAAISQYELGQARPGHAVLLALALRLALPVTFFAPGRPQAPYDLAGAHFRSLRSATQYERQRALAWAEITWEVARAMERAVRLPTFDLPVLPALVGDGQAAELAAARIRKALSLGLGPVPNVVRLLESRGILVTLLPDSALSVDAFSHHMTERPLVMLNPAKRDAARQRLDAAHELGHLVMHHDAEPGGREVERQAQHFAGAFLLPARPLRDELPRRADWDSLFALERRWGVSVQALLFRARELRVMSDVTYRNAMTSLSSKGWRTSEPGDIGPQEQPSLLPRAAMLLQEKGIAVTDIADACRMPEEVVATVLGWTRADEAPDRDGCEDDAALAL